MRRATQSKGFFRSFIGISIHALHEESDLLVIDARGVCDGISIHALHEESDLLVIDARGVCDGISIHALHEESDSTGSICGRRVSHFNPRSP